MMSETYDLKAVEASKTDVERTEKAMNRVANILWNKALNGEPLEKMTPEETKKFADEAKKVKSEENTSEETPKIATKLNEKLAAVGTPVLENRAAQSIADIHHTR